MEEQLKRIADALEKISAMVDEESGRILVEVSFDLTHCTKVQGEWAIAVNNSGSVNTYEQG